MVDSYIIALNSVFILSIWQGLRYADCIPCKGVKVLYKRDALGMRLNCI